MLDLSQYANFTTEPSLQEDLDKSNCGGGIRNVRGAIMTMCSAPVLRDLHNIRRNAPNSQNKTCIKKAATHVIPTPTVLLPNAPRFRIDADFQPLWILALGYRDLQTPLRLDDRAARLSGTAAKGVPSSSNTNRNGRSSG